MQSRCQCEAAGVQDTIPSAQDIRARKGSHVRPLAAAAECDGCLSKRTKIRKVLERCGNLLLRAMGKGYCAKLLPSEGSIVERLRTSAKGEMMITGKLVVMGEIDTVEPDDVTWKHPMALLIEFESAADIRQAIKDGECKFTFGEAK
jgi:hypothetical protein